MNKIWTSEEEEALAKAWIKISVDRQVGDGQTNDGFWRRVLMHFQSHMPRTERTIDQLNSKWTPMHAAIAAFNGYYTQAVYLFRYIYFIYTFRYIFISYIHVLYYFIYTCMVLFYKYVGALERKWVQRSSSLRESQSRL